MRHNWAKSIALLCLIILSLSCGSITSLPTTPPTSVQMTATQVLVIPTVQVTPIAEPTLAPEPAETSTPQPFFGIPSFYLSYRNGWNSPGLLARVEQFPSGVYEIHAEFEYRDVPQMQEIVTAWYRSGNLEGERNSILSEGRGFIHSRLANDDGLPDGEYDFRVYYQGKVVQHGVATIGWKPTVFPLAFTDEDITKWSELRLPETPKTSFHAGVKTIYYVAWVANLPKGTPYKVEWHVNGQLWSSDEEQWTHDSDTGWIGGWTSATDRVLPSGQWEVYIYLGQELARVGVFNIE